MYNHRIACGLIPVVLFCLLGRPTSAAEPKPVRILFAGSSSTYFNDLPEAVANVVSESVSGSPGDPVVAEIIGRSGSDIRVYSEPGFKDYQYGAKPGQTFLGRVAEEKFDFVVLQVVADFMMGGQDPQNRGGAAHADAVTAYCKAIRDAGGEPVFFEMGWGKGERADEGRKRIRELAIKNKVTRFAPCASAWARVYAERPDLKLQHPSDGAHPGDLGHFLNLACFYAAFTGKSPTGHIPRSLPVWPHLSKADQEAKKAEMDTSFERFKPSRYQATLPSWMRRTAAAAAVVTIQPEVATYLETVAWETWQTGQRAVDAKGSQ